MRFLQTQNPVIMYIGRFHQTHKLLVPKRKVQMIKKVVIIVLLSCVASVGFAADHSITARWNMDPVPTDLAGFDLRCNEDNATIVGIDDNTARSWPGIRDLSDGDNLIEIRARDASGQTSSWVPVHYDPAPNDPEWTSLLFKETIAD